MRTLMFGWEFPPYITGGLGTACFGITKALTGLGHEIIFVLPRVKGERHPSHVELISAAEFPVSEQYLKEYSSRLDIRLVDSTLRPYLSEDQYKSLLTGQRIGQEKAGMFFDISGDYGPDIISEVLRYGKAAGTIAKNLSFDVIHAHDWMTIFAGLHAREISRKPFILHIHSLEFDRSGENINRAVFDIERHGMMKADHIIAVSHYTKNIIVNRYGIPPEKISVVHNAVSRIEGRDAYHVKHGQGGKIVLFLGRITFQKGPDYFVEAAAKVIKAIPEVTFVMAGTGDMMPRMVERVAELGIGEHFHFTGFLKGAELERIYTISDLYVMPSVSEPFGISPLEAMMYDVPVIICKQSGVAEILHNALKVDFWNVNEIANKIIAVLKHPPLVDEMLNKSREELRNIRWEKAGEKIVDVYRHLLNPDI
ncbi:MAG: glycosyltransferase family 4 protein [Syntrophales bacterium]